MVELSTRTQTYLNAAGDGTSDDHNLLDDAAAELDAAGGGTISLHPAKTYLVGTELKLPCGVSLQGNGAILKFTEEGGNGIFVSTNASRLGQFTAIEGVTFGRSGSNGGIAVRTEKGNAPFFTQSPHIFVTRCWSRDLEADYTYPSSHSDLGLNSWEWVVDLAHSNGSVVAENDFIGNFRPDLAESGQFASGGVRLGTDGTSGIIATDVNHNRLWYMRNPVNVEEDVLAFWITKNEMIKCYRGVYAPTDPLGDGTSLAADTRVSDNYITTCIGGIDIRYRQLMHIVGNHTNCDAAYYDNGLGFTGIKLTSCSKTRVQGNSANLSAGVASWAGAKRAVHYVDCGSIQTDLQKVSRYFDDAVYADASNDLQFSNMEFTQVTDAGYAFNNQCRNIQIGRTAYVTAEPTERFRFDSVDTNIHDISIIDEFVVPVQASTVTVASNAIVVKSKNHVVDTSSAPQTLNTATGNSVRDGVRMTLRASSSANALTIADGAGGTGQFLLSGAFVTTNARDFIEVEYSEAFTAWLEISRSDNA